MNRTVQFSQFLVQCSPSQHSCNWPTTLVSFHNFNLITNEVAYLLEASCFSTTCGVSTKRWYPRNSLHGVTNQTTISISASKLVSRLLKFTTARRKRYRLLFRNCRFDFLVGQQLTQDDSWFMLFSPEEYKDSTGQNATTATFQILPNSSFILSVDTIPGSFKMLPESLYFWEIQNNTNI